MLNKWTQELMLRVSAHGSGSGFHAAPQYDYVYDRHGNQRVRHVLKYENLEQDFNSLMKSYNISLRLPRIKVNRSPRIRSLTIADFDKKTLEAINNVYARDFEMFQYIPNR